MSYTPIRFSFPAADLASNHFLTDTQLLDYITEALVVIHDASPGTTMTCSFSLLGTGEGTSFREALRDLHSKTVLDVMTTKLSR